MRVHSRRIAGILSIMFATAVLAPAIASASLMPVVSASADVEVNGLTAGIETVVVTIETDSLAVTQLNLALPLEMRPDQVKGRDVEVSVDGADVTVVEDGLDIAFVDGTSGANVIEVTIDALTTPDDFGTYELTAIVASDGAEYPVPVSLEVPEPNALQLAVLWIEDQDFLHLFFSPVIIAEALPVLWKGFQVAVLILFFGYMLAMPGGLTLAFMKMARTRLARWPATFYIDVVRGTPLLVQILLVYFGLTFLPFYREVIDWLGPLTSWSLYNVDATQYYRIIIALALNSSAYMAEIFRAGIQSIHKGQLEAARSLGMTVPAAMAYVIIPQTVRRILPTMMSEFILLFKDTSLAFSVGVFELTLQARTVQARTFNMSPYIAAAGFYLLLTLPLGRFVARLEEKLAVAETGRGPEKKSSDRGVLSRLLGRGTAKESA